MTAFDQTNSATSSLAKSDASILEASNYSTSMNNFQSFTNLEIDYDPPNFPSIPIEIDVEWAEYLNPYVPSLNTTVIDFLLKQSAMNGSKPGAPEIALMDIISGLMTNGLARSGFTSGLQGDIKMTKDKTDTAQTSSDGINYLNEVPDGNLWVSGKSDIFTVDPEESKDWVKLRVSSVVQGYAYNSDSAAPKIAIALLSTYCCFALSYYFYSGISDSLYIIGNILYAPSQTSRQSSIPSEIPHIILPPGGVPPKPPNTTLFQIPYSDKLDYKFVLDHPKSQQQIFKYLPIGLAYGLQISSTNVIVQSLRPYDTTARLGYITTLAAAWIPSNLTDTLGSYIIEANSSIYHCPDTLENTLMSMVSPLVVGMLSSGSTTPNLSPSSKKFSAGFKVVIGVLVPVGVMAILLLVVAYRREQRRKHAVSRNPAKRKRTKDHDLSPFLQQKPELDGEEQMHEMSAEER
ncbi:hypothetical protein MMC22_007178 [Lobaria immixta]|nr:hypothetical protein [Lobaria immixta]